VLAATEIYVGMTTERADRPRLSDDEAAAALRRLESVHRVGAVSTPQRT
jgi:hypothetical protein